LGLEDPTQAHDSIESMAAHYVEELLEAVPNGPYHLGGWCFGGSVALEMARQLRRRGAPVGAVLLMETFPRLRRDGHYWLRNAKLLASMGIEGGRVLVNRLTDFAGGIRHAQDAEEVHALSLERGPFKHRRAVYERNLHAIRTHWSSYYAGPVTLIKGRYSRGGLRDPDYGWHELVDAMDIFEFDTAHASMMKAPFVKTLADVIARSLSKWDHVARPATTSAPAAPPRAPSPASSLSPSPQARGVAASVSNGAGAHD
jgi:thioesterase domain-containing protein